MTAFPAGTWVHTKATQQPRARWQSFGNRLLARDRAYATLEGTQNFLPAHQPLMLRDEVVVRKPKDATLPGISRLSKEKLKSLMDERSILYNPKMTKEMMRDAFYNYIP